MARERRGDHSKGGIVAIFRVIPPGDLDVANGDFVLATGVEFIRQKLSSRFKFFLGEWFLDQREGVPYYRDVFVKNPNPEVIRSIFRQVALSVPGVIALPRFDLVFDPVERLLTFNFEARTAALDTIVVTPTDTLFIIRV